MDKILTAEELCRIEYDDNRPENIFMERSVDMKWAIFMMKQFAKLHVKEALKQASENATVTPIDHEEISEGSFRPIWGVDDESILNAYPLENIK